MQALTPERKTGDLASKAKVLCCRDRHALQGVAHQWEGGMSVGVGGIFYGFGTSGGVAYPWGVDFGSYLFDDQQGEWHLWEGKQDFRCL